LALIPLACGGKQRVGDRGRSAYEAAEKIHRRADTTNATTREALFDQARAKYQQACQEGSRDGCVAHEQLDTALRERRGECRTADECSVQGRGWLPSSRGEQRLRRLCMGERVRVIASAAPPAFELHGPSCVALGDYYRQSNRVRNAAYVYRKGCEEAHYAQACVGEALRVLGSEQVLDPSSSVAGRGDMLRIAEPYAQRGCEIGDAGACELFARLELARHRVRFPDANSLRYSIEDADPKELLLRAKTAAEGACAKGVKQACATAEESGAELERITALLEHGCVFLRNCGRGQVCNEATGRCEGRSSKGGFYAFYDKGIALFDARDLDGANKAFERARRMAPQLPGPWRWLGLIALRQGRYADCAAATEEALRLNPRSKHAAAMRAIVDHCNSVVRQ